VIRGDITHRERRISRRGAFIVVIGLWLVAGRRGGKAHTMVKEGKGEVQGWHQGKD
jgi:hypothetical protein